MEKNLFTFIERNDSNKQFENRLSSSIMANIVGGGGGHKSFTSTELEKEHYCNPWLDCNAWNCAPDCTCKNLA